MDIFSILILFGVASMIMRFLKKVGQASKQAQTQAQAEAANPRVAPKPAPKPAPKRQDFRFPAVNTPVVRPTAVFQEGGAPGAVMSEYTPISPSSDLDSQFSQYKGSLNTNGAEGIGYKSEAYDPVEAPYQTGAGAAVKILPERFSRDTLLQAVVMSEILKRPGARR